MKKRVLFSALVLVLALGFVFTSCSDSLNPLTRVAAPDPTNVTARQVTADGSYKFNVYLTFDTAADVEGYTIYARENGKTVELLASTVATVSGPDYKGYDDDGAAITDNSKYDTAKANYLIVISTLDKGFNFGVQAKGVNSVSTESAPSNIVWAEGAFKGN